MLHVIETCWPHPENPFIWWGRCRFVMYCVVFDKQLRDLSIFMSHLKSFKLSLNFWEKKEKRKRKAGAGGRRGIQ